MGVFDDVLKDSESLFKNEFALDFEFIPKELPHRENQQKYVAECIAPLFNNRNGRNLFICGAPGIGKTVAVRHVFKELEEKTSDVIPIYVNCWKKDTSYKILVSICEQIGYKWTHNKRTDELLDVVSKILNKKTTAICLDEVDKVKEIDILYSLSEDLLKKSIIVIANDKGWISNLDQRIRSRFMPEHLEFPEYSAVETRDIIRERIKFAFFDGIWDAEAMNSIIDRAAEMKDVRAGLFLLKEAGNSAESKASRQILCEHSDIAISKLEGFKIKNSSDFGEDERVILELVKNHSGKTVKELYDVGGLELSYRHFHRKIDELKKNSMIFFGDKREGSTIVNYGKKLTDY